MNIDKFIKDRQADWEQLEATLKRLQKSELKDASESDLTELGNLYRRVVSDLSFAKANFKDVRLLIYLNQLVGKAYAKIYRDEPFTFMSIVRFFAVEFPSSFRKFFNYILISFALFAVSGIIGFFMTTADHKIAVYSERQVRSKFNEVQRDNKWANIRPEVRPSASSMIMTNNIKVAFMAFAYGISLGIGTVIVLINNGLMLGSISGLCFMKGIGFLLWSFVFPHGMIELTCIFIAGGAGLLIGDSFLRPGELKRQDALKKNAVEAVKLIAGIIPMLVIAGTIEGFVSPSSINGWLKIAIGCFTAVLMFLYFFYAGRPVLVRAARS